MLNPRWLREDEVLKIAPDDEVREEDFAALAAMIDPVIARRGRLEGLLIDARGFEGWDDARALLAHLRFVHRHVDKVARVAAVGDQWWLSAAEAVVDPLYGTPARVFLARQAEEAEAWLLERPAERPSVEVLPDSAGPLVALRVSGRLRQADIDRLLPVLEAALPAGGRLDLVVEVAGDFRGGTPKAMLEDFALAFTPWRRRFRRVAMVAAPGPLRWIVEHLPPALIPYDLRVFAPEERTAALAWAAAER